jgi:hypothetical protein
MFPRLAKTFAVIVSSTILATLAVNAVDMRGHMATSWLASVFQNFSVSVREEGPCPRHMVVVTEALEPFCIDMYEASPNRRCPFSNPTSPQETMINLTHPSCHAVSEPLTIPWRYVDRDQAQEACEIAGKRLPTAGEWYKAARGTTYLSSSLNESQCNIASNRADGIAPTGSGYRCVSSVGAYDMVGNAWEWVLGDVVKGIWEGRTVPSTGFVTAVDMDGMALETSTAHDERFGSDRFWSDVRLEAAGVMRGGYYDSKTNAGVFSVYAGSPTSFSGVGTGFRCVTEPNSDYLTP